MDLDQQREPGPVLEPTPRRRLLQSMFWAAASFMAAIVAGPAAVAFLAPMRRRTVTGGGQAAKYGKVAELTLGVPRRFDVVSARTDAWARSNPKPIGALWLVRRSDDRVDAFSVVCPHLGCPVGYDPAQRVFVCPCHESGFSPVDGSRLKGPSPRGLDPLPVSVGSDGAIEVTYKQYVQGIPARREVP